jgi:hypothetical protein
MIKTYKSQIDLFHAFMYGDESFKGRSSNVFAKGNEIYSYGYHFMLAKKEVHDNQTYILLNSNTYSNTTSKQQSLLSRAVPNNYIRIYVEDPKQTPRVLIQRSIGKIKECLSKIPRATSNKLHYLSSANQEARNIIKLADLYPEQISLKDYQFIEYEFKPEDYISQDWFKKQEEKQAKRKAKEEAEAVIRKLKGDEQLIKWLNFEIDNCYNYSGLTRLRYNSKTECIETTLGIKLHKDKVKELYEKLSNKEDVIGLKIEQFRVLSIENNILTVGCHKLNLTEILKFGKQIFGE